MENEIRGLARLAVAQEVMGGRVPEGVSPDMVLRIMNVQQISTEGRVLTRRERRAFKEPFRIRNQESRG